jgi:hypothetical protein
MIRLQWWESGPYFAGFSLRIPDMRNFFNVHESVKICTRSPRVQIEPMFRYRTPKSDRLLADSARVPSLRADNAIIPITHRGNLMHIATPANARIGHLTTFVGLVHR